MIFFVYILKCNDNSFYTGHTENLEKRLFEHNNKKFSGYTSTRLPISLVYSEAFTSRVEALEAERKIKKWGRRKKEALIKSGWKSFLKD